MKRPPIKDGFAYDKENRTAYYDLSDNGRSGRRVRKIVRDIGYRAALKKKRELMDNLEATRDRRRTETLTLREYLKEYPSRLGRHAESTLQRHDTLQRVQLLPILGDIALDKITEAVALDWRSKLLNSGISAGTVNRCVAHLVMLLHEAIKRAELTKLGFPPLKPLDEGGEKDRYLTVEERKQFLSAFDDWRAFKQDWKDRLKKGPVVQSIQSTKPRRCGGAPDEKSNTCRDTFKRFQKAKLFFVALFDTGMRRGELLKLTVNDLNLDLGLLRADRGKGSEHGWIPMTSVIREGLRAEMQETPRLGNAQVFRLSVSTVRRYFAIAKRLSGIEYTQCGEPFRLHDCRHTFASSLVQAGVDLYKTQKLLGHTTPRMTQRYAHLSPDHMRDAIEALEVFNVGNLVGNTAKKAINSNSAQRAEVSELRRVKSGGADETRTRDLRRDRPAF